MGTKALQIKQLLLLVSVLFLAGCEDLFPTCRLKPSLGGLVCVDKRNKPKKFIYIKNAKNYRCFSPSRWEDIELYARNHCKFPKYPPVFDKPENKVGIQK
jgi:hypothetical protein